jgi:hypothetical protein
VLVSEGGFVGSGDLRQMSEFPIPHGGQYHSCILRRWRPAFLHPKGEIQIWHSKIKMLSRLFPSNKGANQTSTPEKAHESMANEKNPPNPELKRP